MKYIENFDNGPGGWIGWNNNTIDGSLALQTKKSAIVSKSPWWVDYNHAPPGGGCLHLLFSLFTTVEGYANSKEKGGINQFINGGYPLDWTNAHITVRLKGEVTLRGANLYLLAQAKVGQKFVNSILIKQPLMITSDWSVQHINLVPDSDQWICIGSHASRTDRYGMGKATDVLLNLNCNIIFVLFPLDVFPVVPLEGNPHLLRAGEDYVLDRSRLPEGYVMMDSIEISFQ